ncbi:MAG: hypothetical protein K6G11_05275 [Lachnospiraceae bacterium]|nr:hypothetical protein [Lachnospiraceae bacterium]
MIEKGCTGFIDMNMNDKVGGLFVYLGYNAFNLNYDEINNKKTENAKEAEKQKRIIISIQLNKIVIFGGLFKPPMLRI